MNVDLVAENDVAGVLANTEGGVVASVPEDATLHFNGNTEVPVDRADVTLFSDDLLPGNREDALIDRAEQALSIDLSAAQQASTYDFQYLDLVDVRQSNAWVSSSDDTAIYWRLPEGADASSIQIIHFKDLHRDTAMDDTTVADLIGKAEVETMEILNKDSVAADGYVKFAVPTSGFSPFLMVWTAADPGVDPDPDPGTGGNPGGGPGADPEPEPEGSVQVPESEGGQTTVANPEARPGRAISESAAPADGWLVDRITVTDAEGNTVHVHYVGTGFYEFEMPEGGATVDVDYRKVTGALSFDDVAEGDWFFEVVGKVSGHGFMVGIGSTPLFDPNGSLDRAMMAQVIYNVAGRPSVDAAARLAFDDTPADAWYAEAVLWCAEEGVVGGYGGTNLYGPGDPVTREQLATMLWRLSGEPAAQEGALAAFPDAAAASDYAVSALCWAVEQGILRGDGGDGTLRPADTATRAEVATMVMRWWEDVALA